MPRVGELIIGLAVGAAILTVVVAALFVRNREGPAPGLTQSERIEQSFETDGSPRIVIESWRGPVTVRGTTDGAVRVEILRTGTGATEQEAFDNLTRLESRVVQDGDTITVRTFRSDPAAAPAGTRAVVVVLAPPGAAVEIAATGDEGVTVVDITGELDVTAEAGIDVEVAPGAAFELDAASGAGTIDDAIGLDAAPVVNGQGQVLIARRGEGGNSIVLRAGADITISR